MNGLWEFLYGCIALFLMVSGCVAIDGAEPQCRASEGFRAAGLSAGEACDRFMASLSATLGEAGRADIAADHAFDLSVSGKGTITATVSFRDTRRASHFPPVAVDAMDRALERSDIERLAQAVALLLLDHNGADRAAPQAGGS